MSAHNAHHKVFSDGIERCRQMVFLFEYACQNYPAALDCSDILRSSISMAVSSLDLLVHSLYKTEVLQRLKDGNTVEGLLIPFNPMIMSKSDAHIALDEFITSSNSYKSFVAPDKIASLLCHLMVDPWDKISKLLGSDQKTVKTLLKEIVRWRNRIVHEADINPAYGGIELWSIKHGDVVSSIDFLETLGGAIYQTILVK